MNATNIKPCQPSSAAIAAEFGIEVGAAGWKKVVAERRPESRLQIEYEAALAAWFASPEGQQEQAYTAAKRAREEAYNAKLRAAGMEHLIGAKFEKSRAGSWGVVHGNKVCALNASQCEVLGFTAGPANF
jgi:hypothetical protein